MGQGSHVIGVVPPHVIGRDDANPDDLRVVLRLYDGYYAANAITIGGSGAAGNAPIQIRCLIDRSYLDLVRRNKLQNRPLRGVSSIRLLTALRREAGISAKGPRLHEEFSPVVKETA